MANGMKIDQEIADGVLHLTVTESNFATVTDDSDFVKQTFTAQLANDSEAHQLLKELESTDGEEMYEENSIVGKYPQFHPLRP